MDRHEQFIVSGKKYLNHVDLFTPVRGHSDKPAPYVKDAVFSNAALRLGWPALSASWQACKGQSLKTHEW